MSYMRLFEMAAVDVPTPPTGKSSLFIDSTTGEWSYKDDTGVVTSLQGPAGPGVPVGGTAGQALVKINSTDYNTQWATPVTYTGTAGSITLTGAAFSIDAAYVGQASITTLGTITTGTWNGTAIGPTFGGTGLTSYAAGDIVYASATNVLSKLAAGTNTHVLTMVAGVPAWQAGGTGDVAGPASAVNNNIAVFDTTTGKLIKDGGVAIAGLQPLDSDLTTIAGLTATTDNFIQSKSSAWASRTVAQVNADLQGTGLIATSCGLRIVAQNSKSAAYTLVAADSGGHIYHPSADTTARTWTIPANSSVAYPIGTALTFVNDLSAGVITIAITTDTLVLAGVGSTGSRTLAAGGIATALKMTSTRWMISGTGLT